jgi:hypothetical protein
LPTKSLLYRGTGAPAGRYVGLIRLVFREHCMSTLGLQDVFEPYYEGRGNSFATIRPDAVERARQLKERLEAARKAAREAKAERPRAA